MAGLIIGAWPAVPDAIDTDNRTYFETALELPLLGAIPAGAGALDPALFRIQAPGWLALPPSSSAT